MRPQLHEATKGVRSGALLSFRVEGARGSRCPPGRREDDVWWPDPELSLSVRAHAEAVTGYRDWILHPTAEGPRLRSPWSSTMWKPRESLEASCLPLFGYINAWAWREAQRRFPHRFAPDPRCRCGIAARARKGNSSVDGGITRLQGIARGWGLVISWTSGWRAQYAEPVALLADTLPEEFADRLAEDYGIALL
jgi:hypothetical protein